MATPDPGLPRNIGAPATRALTVAGYAKLSQLAGVPAAELSALHGVDKISSLGTLDEAKGAAAGKLPPPLQRRL